MLWRHTVGGLAESLSEVVKSSIATNWIKFSLSLVPAIPQPAKCMFIVGLCWFTSKLTQCKHILYVTLTIIVGLSKATALGIRQEVEQIRANVFYSTFLNVFLYFYHIFTVFNVLFFLERFLHLCASTLKGLPSVWAVWQRGWVPIAWLRLVELTSRRPYSHLRV